MKHHPHILATVSLLSLCGLARAADEYQFLPVEAFPGFSIPECYLRDINNAGMAVGTSTITVQDPQGNLHGVYTGTTWTLADGKVPFDNNSYPTAISDTGWVAGSGVVTFLPTGQTFTLPQVPGTYGSPLLLGVNDAGTAVGWIQTCVCSNSQGLQQVPYIWDLAGGARTIPVTGAKELVRINNSGVAVGNIRAAGGLGDAFIYDLNSGATTILSTVLPPPPAGVVYKIVASDINDSGTVTGYIRENITGHNLGFTWSPQAGAVLLSPPPGSTYLQDVRPASINRTGAVAGILGYTSGGARPFIYDPAHGVRDLAALTTPALTFQYWYASAVNDQGWVTAYGYVPGNGFASAVLKPAPACYANCDSSTTAPILNANDFQCFLNLFAAGDQAANCDNSTAAPVLNANDFQCFLNTFAAGCP